ncbi:hypothetical protein MVEN_01935500 [Mycena venus]|uniref:Uncharacterized protein n=1 Tax=Mycena venus TaxID=2733690 RepID=A0A8H6XG89_9AGAR|nr:hypothetical protein MVEN_01935500 [Mycena venus]
MRPNQTIVRNEWLCFKSDLHIDLKTFALLEVLDTMSAPKCALVLSSLPNELLEAIVVAGQEDRVTDSNWQTQFGTFKSEWTLSHVSRRFRNVIVGAPALWTLAEADLDVEGSAEILKLYLDRSQGYKISATLRSDSKVAHYDILLRRLNPLVHHINRIWRLRMMVVLREEWGAAMLVPFRDGAAPYLQRLEIVNNLIEGDNWGIQMFCSGAPRLSFLRVDGFKFELPAAPWAAPLTHLELRRSTRYLDPANVRNLVAVTMQCHSLVHFCTST